MPIRYNPNEPLREYFAIYRLPVTLEECVDQYRIDRIEQVDHELGLTIDDYVHLRPLDDSPIRHIAGLFDPLGFFADSSLAQLPPATQALLPPVPSSLAEFDPRFATWSAPFIEQMKQRLESVSQATVLRLASAIATSYFDTRHTFGKSRDRAVAYLAMNSADNPARQHIGEIRWESHRRVLDIPDMVETRKQDLRALFDEVKLPLRPVELEHIEDQVLFEYAADMRMFVLEQNRHIVFCSKCSARVLEVNSQLYSPVSHFVM